MPKRGLCNSGSVVVTPPSPFLQVAGGAPRAPASTTACVRTASVATPAPVPRATRERTVLSVRHCPPSEKPHLLLSQCPRETIHSYPIMPVTMFVVRTHSSWQSRGDVCCLSTKHHGILRLRGLSLRPEPPFSGDAAKGLKPNHLTGRPQSQPCHRHPHCLAACPAVVPGVWPEGPKLQCQSGFPRTLGPLRPHTPTGRSLRTKGLQKTNRFQWK